MKTVVIIGGSKGIGNAILNALIDSHRIINISRTIPATNHDNLTHFSSDITTGNLPPIHGADALIYCPGSINLRPFDKLDVEDFSRDFEINVLGAVKSIQHVLPMLKNGNHPSILLFSTVATKLGMPFHSSITTSKSGVEGLVKSLGAEFAPHIRVNAIAPTITNTNLASKLLRNSKLVEAITEKHPLKKILNPNEVAEMASFLISNKAASISGQIFEMDCGIVNFKI